MKTDAQEAFKQWWAYNGNRITLSQESAWSIFRDGYYAALALPEAPAPSECICPKCGIRHGGGNASEGF